MLYFVDFLYYGILLGLWIKVIWFIFGLILSGMLISGFMIYSKCMVKVGCSKKLVCEMLSNIVLGVLEFVEGV